jgi:outer membrane protein
VPPDLTLEQAIAIAMRSNPGQIRLSNDVSVADANVRARYGAFLPRISVGAGFSSTYRETQTGTGDFGEPLPTPRAVITKTSGSNQTIGLGSLTLFDGGQQFRNVSIAKTERRGADASYDGGANTLRANVTRAYFQVVNVARRVELERQLLTFAQERLDFVQQQFEIAAARQSDLLGAQGEVMQREQAVNSAELDVRQRRLTLLQQMGVSGEPAFTTTTDLPPVLDPATLDADALVARALAQHPAVRQAEASADASEMRAANARATRLPTVSLSLPSYSWGATESGLWDAWGKLGAPNNSFQFSIRADLPVFTGFQTSANVRTQQAAAEDARQTAREQRLAIEVNVRNGLIELERQHRNLVIAQQQADLAAQRLELSQEEYRLGAITFTALQQVIQSNDTAQRGVIDAQFLLLSARVDLEERIGGPLTGN